MQTDFAKDPDKWAKEKIGEALRVEQTGTVLDSMLSTDFEEVRKRKRERFKELIKCCILDDMEKTHLSIGEACEELAEAICVDTFDSSVVN